MSRPRRPQPGEVNLHAAHDEAARGTIREELLTNILVEAGAGSRRALPQQRRTL